MSRHTLFNCKYGHFEAEYYGDEIFVHFNAKNWSVTGYRTLYQALDLCLAELSETVDHLYSLVPKDNHKRLKFGAMFGFEIVGKVNDHFILRRATK